MHSFIHSFIPPQRTNALKVPTKELFALWTDPNNTPSVARNVSIQYGVSFCHIAIDRHCRTKLGVVYVCIVWVLLRPGARTDSLTYDTQTENTTNQTTNCLATKRSRPRSVLGTCSAVHYLLPILTQTNKRTNGWLVTPSLPPPSPSLSVTVSHCQSLSVTTTVSE